MIEFGGKTEWQKAIRDVKVEGRKAYEFDDLRLNGGRPRLMEKE